MVVLATGSLVGSLALTSELNAAPRTIRIAGATFSWPLTTPREVVTPGARLVVTVRKSPQRSKRREVAKKDRPEVMLLRITPNGGKKTVRRIRFERRGTIRVPSGWNQRYELRLRVGAETYATSFISPPPPPAPPPTMAPPAAAVATVPQPSVSGEPCPPSSVAPQAMMEVQSSVVVGDSVEYLVRNTGARCVSLGSGFKWEQRVDGAWVERRAPTAGGSGGSARVVEPGQSLANQAIAWPDLPPGQYRLSAEVNAFPSTAPRTAPDMVVFAEVTMTART